MFRRRSDVQISDMYPIKIHIWNWPRSDAKKNQILCRFLCLHMCNKFQSVSEGAKKKKNQNFCASVNTALVSAQQ